MELFRIVLYVYNIHLIYIETYSVSLDGTKGIAGTGEAVDAIGLGLGFVEERLQIRAE